LIIRIKDTRITIGSLLVIAYASRIIVNIIIEKDVINFNFLVLVFLSIITSILVVIIIYEYLLKLSIALVFTIFMK
jgi:hypothetical protein